MEFGDDGDPNARLANPMHKVKGVNPSFDAPFISPPRDTIIFMIDKLMELIRLSSICKAVSPFSFLVDNSIDGDFNIVLKIVIDFFAGTHVNVCINAVFPFSSTSFKLNPCFNKTFMHFSTRSASP